MIAFMPGAHGSKDWLITPGDGTETRLITSVAGQTGICTTWREVRTTVPS